MVHKKHRGALSELQACSFLIKEGYEVFRNVSPHGLVDLIARNPTTKELILIDVKTGSYNTLTDGTVKYCDAFPATKQKLKDLKENDIKVLAVNGNTGDCKFYD